MLMDCLELFKSKNGAKIVGQYEEILDGGHSQ